MSSKDEPKFTVGLKHLSAECKEAGANLPDQQVDGVSPKRLRAMLKSLAALAPKIAYPVAPELRVTTHDKFVVQVKEGQLRLISWSASQPAGGGLTADQIFSTITGEAVAGEVERPRSSRSSAADVSPGMRQRNRIIIGFCIVGIIVCNSVTAWVLTRPPRDLLPKYTPMDAEPAERLLSGVVGVYETGTAASSRRLQIDKDGSATLVKYGTNKKVLSEKKFSVKGVQVAGKPTLLSTSATANRKTMIEIKDPVTVVMYGDSYRRVVK